MLQSSSGDIGGMMIAGALLLVLGLAGVAVLHGRLSTVLERMFGSSSDAAETSVEEPSESHHVSAEPEASEAVREAEAPADQEQPARTDEEVIVDILEGNDGRMKQARIVDATGWSKSKVSMLLSEMEDEEAISKLRVGRENIISLRGNEPDAAGSPFDED